MTRKIKEKTRFWQVKKRPPYSYAFLGLSEIACEAKWSFMGAYARFEIHRCNEALRAYKASHRSNAIAQLGQAYSTTPR